MENPGTWDDTQRLINQCIYVTGPDTPGRSVIEALRKNNLLKQEPDNLETVINEELKRIQEMVNSGFCGSSSSRQIYNLLLNLGVV